jgi:hypothetical protein
MTQRFRINRIGREWRFVQTVCLDHFVLFQGLCFVAVDVITRLASRKSRHRPPLMSVTRVMKRNDEVSSDKVAHKCKYI